MNLIQIRKKKFLFLTNAIALLTPVALAHLIMGDGGVRNHGLVLCTNSFVTKDVVRLLNVLVTNEVC